MSTQRSVAEHRARVLALGTRLTTVDLPAADAVGTVLAAPLVARLDVPPFDNSAMDGFALRSEDLVEGRVLEVLADIPAGAHEIPTVSPGTAARVMTGAPVPPGADSVLPVEHTDHRPGDPVAPASVTVTTATGPGRHVRRRGEDVSVGDVVVDAGSTVTPAVASAAVSLGYASLPVTPPPRVTVLSTGSELVPPGSRLSTGQIPDSNSTLLSTLVEQFGATAVEVHTVPDDEASFADALASALRADVVVSTGGISQGAFEVVRRVAGAELDVTTVAMQPGKPQACGALRAPDGRLVPMLGLPGNPVSAFVSAWVFLRPLLRLLAGHDPEPTYELAVAGQGWDCRPGKTQFIPVADVPAPTADHTVAPVYARGFGSHRVGTLARSCGLVVVDEPVERVEAGDTVRVLRTDST